MGLQLILGNSGSGKTRYINEKVLEIARRKPRQNILLVVPEQFTMQTQKELVRLQEGHSIMTIDILSFQRLAFRVFDEIGIVTNQVLEETGKNLLLRKVAGEKEKELTVLKNKMTKMGYITEVKSLISELTQYNISPERLEEEISTLEEGGLKRKLSDLLCMYEGFREEIDGRFITAEEILTLLAQHVNKSNKIRGSILVIDGFTGFTPIQHQLLEELLPLTKETYVTVTLDERENPFHIKGIWDLFAMSKDMIKHLQYIAQKANVEVLEPLWIEAKEHSRFKQDSALLFLEQNLFRMRKNAYQKTCQGIELHALLNPKEELTFAAEKIIELVRKKGYRYNEIAVVCSDLGVYSNYAKEVFDEYQIPIFLDQKETILNHPFVEFVRSILMVISDDFSYESVFRFLRSGFAQISRARIDEIENYVIAKGIRTKASWVKEFTWLMPHQQEETLCQINETRELIYQKFFAFTHLTSSATVETITKALYQTLVELKASEQLSNRENEALKKHQLREAKEYGQIYKITMELLEKMVSLLKEEILTIEEYEKILDAGFEAAKVGLIPPGIDSVMVGDIERTRLNQIKALFFLGVNDGFVPKTGGSDGLLTQIERMQLAEDAIELAPTSREKLFIQKYYLYLLLTKPSGELYLSYSKISGEGKSIRPSYLIPLMKKLLPTLEIQEQRNPQLFNRLVTPENSIHIFVELLSLGMNNVEQLSEEQIHIWTQLYQWYEQEPKWKEKMDIVLEGANYTYKMTPISKAVSKVIYGETLEASVTRLEQFASCAFAHFLNYGLSLKEREVHSFEATDMGTLFHQILELFSHQLKERHTSFRSVSEEEVAQILPLCMEEAIHLHHNLAMEEDARSRYIKARMYRILNRAIWAISEQVKKGSFEPSHFEISFQEVENLKSVNFQLGEKEKMHLKGRIDRIDSLDYNDQVFVKVIDYKSGNTAFQLLNIYHGLQLQLVVYMNAALEILALENKGKEVIPAGVFYSYLKDPMVEFEQMATEDEIQAQIFKAFKLSGIVNSDHEIYREMDGSLKQGASVSSDILPFGLNKDGSIKKNAKVQNTQEIKVMSNYVNEKMITIGKRILEGDIEIGPYQLDQQTACDYCEFGAICMFDPKIPGFSYRKFQKLEDQDILERMKEEREDEHTMD